MTEAKKLLELYTRVIEDGPVDDPAREVFVFISGWPDNSNIFNQMIAMLSLRLRNRKRSFKAYLIDLPNYEPVTAQDAKPDYYSWLEATELLHKTIEKFKIRQATWVVHDWGCIMTYIYLQKYGKNGACSRLISLDVGKVDLSIFNPFGVLFMLTYQGLLNVAFTLGPFGGNFLSSRVAKYASWSRIPYDETKNPHWKDCWPYRSLWIDLITNGGNNTLKLSDAWQPQPDQPFLFLHGTSKPFFAHFHYAEWIKLVTSQNKNSYAKGIPGSHWFLVENPEKVVEEIDKFIQSTTTFSSMGTTSKL